MPALLSVAVVLFLLALGGADYAFVERPHHLAQQSGASASTIVGWQTASSSDGTPVKKGVQKKAQIDITALVSSLSFTMQTTEEKSLMEQVNPSQIPVETRVLLQSNDRAALLAWMDTPDAKTVYVALKQALLQSLSSRATDVSDQALEPADGPPYDLLSFRDPAISEEQFLFIRIRTRLYVFQITSGKESAVRQIVDALTK